MYNNSPYPRRLESLTICGCNYKGSTFSLVVLRPWVLVRPESNSRPPAWQPGAQLTNWVTGAWLAVKFAWKTWLYKLNLSHKLHVQCIDREVLLSCIHHWRDTILFSNIETNFKAHLLHSFVRKKSQKGLEKLFLDKNIPEKQYQKMWFLLLDAPTQYFGSANDIIFFMSSLLYVPVIMFSHFQILNAVQFSSKRLVLVNSSSFCSNLVKRFVTKP